MKLISIILFVLIAFISGCRRDRCETLENIPAPTQTHKVSDTGITFALFGAGLGSLILFRRKLK